MHGAAVGGMSPGRTRSTLPTWSCLIMRSVSSAMFTETAERNSCRARGARPGEQRKQGEASRIGASRRTCFSMVWIPW